MQVFHVAASPGTVRVEGAPRRVGGECTVRIALSHPRFTCNIPLNGNIDLDSNMRLCQRVEEEWGWLPKNIRGY